MRDYYGRDEDDRRKVRDPYEGDSYLSGIVNDSREWDPYLNDPFYDDFYLLEDEQALGKISSDRDEFDYMLPEMYKNDARGQQWYDQGQGALTQGGDEQGSTLLPDFMYQKDAYSFMPKNPMFYGFAHE